jgi:H+/gluconate symporter-like permease
VEKQGDVLRQPCVTSPALVSVLVSLLALGFLILVAYRGYSVILFAPVAALGAVALTVPGAVLPAYSALFMDNMATFLKNYFPVFMLGALFGKLMELSGFAQAVAAGISRVTGRGRAMLGIVTICALMVYGGVSVIVIAFAVYPFAAELFRAADIPKRLIPATIALGSYTFAMDAVPGSPQIQNIIPTTFFGTTTMAAPILGPIGGLFILIVGMAYLNRRGRSAAAVSEGYGLVHFNEPERSDNHLPVSPLVAFLPLVAVAASNIAFTNMIPRWYGTTAMMALNPGARPLAIDVSKQIGIWAVEAALVLGIGLVVLLAWARVTATFAKGSQTAVSGSLLAAVNTASEYGFGAVIAALPGFLAVQSALKNISNPLVNEAITVTTLAGMTGSASGGLSLALAAMADQFKTAAVGAHIPLEVLHRVAAMASGGMDTLPHNGAIITLLAITGLTHRQSYRDIFAITCIKTSAVFFLIAVYYLTGIV